MAGEAVKKLLDAEREAAERIEQAKATAKKIVADALLAGDTLVSDEEDASVKREKGLLEKAAADALSEKARIEAEAEGEREKLSALAEGKMADAVSLITERVVNG